MQIFASLEVNWCTEAVWIIVMFLSAVWILHSDGTHSLVSKEWNATFLQLYTIYP